MSQTVFVTGATGYIGSAVVKRLLAAGFDVCGLTHRPGGLHTLREWGAEPIEGDLNRPEEWIERLSQCEAVVHAAVDHETTWDADATALGAIEKAAARGSLRKFIYTSGVWVHGESGGATLDETAPLRPLELVKTRAKHEARACAIAALDTIVLRPAIVYGEMRGIIGKWFESGLTSRTVSYPGDGEQTWPLIHRDDLAEAYLLALRRGRKGEAYIIADGSSFKVRELAEATAKASGAVAKSWPAPKVREALGAFGLALLASQKVSAAKAERELGWRPNHSDFVAEASALLREFHDASE
jgi:nucleoside-diphosphate-sugar epimerase